ncbi:MAG: nuclear transport factor 2 family protein [Hyphomonas sp.]|uniref:nuclear transport factor 2 family protein n=1 Tax=Hyphomonas sp. TaxID=87 RepID=UPI0017FA3E7A|nr:nuclear transport factor 2 family protein [Hyphomonas sp.]MBA3068690.1 nuclear transport factor 2 family protein [Hyphomonas sp.]MBU3921383.1 nuclear transport factor 2 family protein [Alphaproteobacteria bacterium]MBU4063647.1 nuclear transport factor 2 family protein [Alphaproteobacteria bacterium]MBU4165728.1 nuclear transport factor 2 family protein [Alphaproteobacteria bacterium]
MKPPFDRAKSEKFARAWLSAWNDRDIDRILSHYSDAVVFHSPRIALVMGTDAASISGKPALRDYWTKALARSPELFFELENVLTSSDAITLLYTNHREELVAETFVFDGDGEVSESVAAYR